MNVNVVLFRIRIPHLKSPMYRAALFFRNSSLLWKIYNIVAFGWYLHISYHNLPQNVNIKFEKPPRYIQSIFKCTQRSRRITNTKIHSKVSYKKSRGQTTGKHKKFIKYPKQWKNHSCPKNFEILSALICHGISSVINIGALIDLFQNKFLLMY